MKALTLPLQFLGRDSIATAALAGVILSLLGTLAGMLALYDMSREYLEEEGRLRAVFYLLIFPSSFFLAQIYTEGMFIGLAFWSLALMKRKQWLWASLLALLAAWTRAYGAALVLPLAYCWLASFDPKQLNFGFLKKWLFQGLCVLMPLAAYFLWRNSPLGQGWAELQAFYFGRGLMTIQTSLDSWRAAYEYAIGSNAGMIYFGVEVFTVAVALLASLGLLLKDRPVALFSLAVVILSIFSGSAQSLERYMLVAPATFIVLGILGRNRPFDRTWTIVSFLLMGMSISLYTLKFWVG
jgi:hypothetical protein